MSQTQPTAELNESFSEPGATARPWTEVAEVLAASEMVLAFGKAPYTQTRYRFSA